MKKVLAGLLAAMMLLCLGAVGAHADARDDYNLAEDKLKVLMTSSHFHDDYESLGTVYTRAYYENYILLPEALPVYRAADEQVDNLFTNYYSSNWEYCVSASTSAYSDAWNTIMTTVSGLTPVYHIHDTTVTRTAVMQDVENARMAIMTRVNALSIERGLSGADTVRLLYEALDFLYIKQSPADFPEGYRTVERSEVYYVVMSTYKAYQAYLQGKSLVDDAAGVVDAAYNRLFGGGGVVTFTVTYSPNGSGVTNLPAPQNKTQGTPLTLSATVPVRAGYTFKGWATSANGAVAYAPGGEYTNENAVILYAVWEKDGGGTDEPGDCFFLWGKETKWEKGNFWNWILLIVCFGWIWMVF